MARGKYKVRAENRRAQLDNEVMQQMKEENRAIKAELDSLRSAFHGQAVQHEREKSDEVKRRTADAIAKAQERIELTEDAARAFVQSRTEAIVSATVAVYNQVPNPVSESWGIYLNTLKECGVDDFDKFFHELVKTIDSKSRWGRHHGRNLRKAKLVESRWREEIRAAQGFDPEVIKKMEKMAGRREQEG